MQELCWLSENAKINNIKERFMKQQRKKSFTTIILILVFIIGLSLLLYPSISDYWNKFHQSRAIVSYIEEVAEMPDEAYEQIWQDAISYNEELAKKGNSWVLTTEEYARYEDMLRISESGVIGCVEISELDISLPIYHGTDEKVLQNGAGHVEGSSLPTGGSSTHCVLSGHRGLPSATLFTNLSEMQEGDTFTLRILDEVLTYKVDQILIVNPKEVSALEIEEGKDLCTLVTCTPYGINSHRLLVRGYRVANEDTDSVRIISDAMQIDKLAVASVIGSMILLILSIGVMVGLGKRR